MNGNSPRPGDSILQVKNRQKDLARNHLPELMPVFVSKEWKIVKSIVCLLEGKLNKHIGPTREVICRFCQTEEETFYASVKD